MRHCSSALHNRY